MQGSLRVQGSKNAVLPIMAAAVLCQGETVITNCPDITDVHAMSEVIRRIGGQVAYEKNCLVIDSSAVGTGVIEEEKVKEIRASILFLGSLLARFSKVKIHYPGGWHRFSLLTKISTKSQAKSSPCRIPCQNNLIPCIAKIQQKAVRLISILKSRRIRIFRCNPVIC